VYTYEGPERLAMAIGHEKQTPRPFQEGTSPLSLTNIHAATVLASIPHPASFKDMNEKYEPAASPGTVTCPQLCMNVSTPIFVPSRQVLGAA
jgi:hypothetical protein